MGQWIIFMVLCAFTVRGRNGSFATRARFRCVLLSTPQRIKRNISARARA